MSSSPSRKGPYVINTALATHLLQQQFPHWSHLPLTPLPPSGSDHVIFRLGRDMAVRLPRGDWAAGQAVKEHRWHPLLAPHLPLAVPTPLALGEPDPAVYPWHWSVARWLEGRTASPDPAEQSPGTPEQLADFLLALHDLAPAASHLPGPHPDLADSPLHLRDADTRSAIAATAHVFDGKAMTALWEAALEAPARADTAPTWFHGDFHTGNLLTDDGGRLTAVIDFGNLGMGDPAVDMMVAYTLLTPESRAAFRTALAPDDATWLRGMGWAMATGLNAYTAYAATNPRVATQTHRQVTAALAEFALVQ
ncbi:aminoglycoside phosphotransferase family protein [Streptomyces sp. NBC_00237]|uniref:aminoglycoside phosphotransferase family protein n=1 Tax=Streptomyces sp. NBC_00237 TaxID=2975687 RepID=UPI0022587DA0|nr:aminoglycoside phosphotransferase family protein [Streptomyces sp. NBC_00237]MCX5204509.1 aminoglycoside phosphotransferase family protein [Streptomyces sp. NBC_00237]